MNAQIDLFTVLLEENYNHARLHEEHRANCTNFVMAIAAGLLAVGSQFFAMPLTATFFGGLTCATGIYGVLLALKHFERYTYHLKVASGLRDAIEAAAHDESKALPKYAEILSAAQQQHFEANIFRARGSTQALPAQPNGCLKSLRLNKLYISINALVIISGAIFIAMAWLTR